MMNKEEIFDLVNANPVFHLATVENGRPRVRAMGLFRADEDGLIFQTQEMKDLHKQLTANPDVECCFYSAERGMQIRISGSVEPEEDPELRDEIIAERKFLEPWIGKWGIQMIKVYRLRNGKAAVWTMKTNFEPKTYIEL
jgi:uncharacterized pyridoxamine 5'-phosphate oxidase family protein